MLKACDAWTDMGQLLRSLPKRKSTNIISYRFGYRSVLFKYNSGHFRQQTSLFCHR